MIPVQAGCFETLQQSQRGAGLHILHCTWHLQPPRKPDILRKMRGAPAPIGCTPLRACSEALLHFQGCRNTLKDKGGGALIIKEGLRFVLLPRVTPKSTTWDLHRTEEFAGAHRALSCNNSSTAHETHPWPGTYQGDYQVFAFDPPTVS